MAEHPINPQHNVFKKYRQVNYYINPYVFTPPVDLSTNTEIGGVAATISTPALLATKLGISVGSISNFTIVGSDIKCKITGTYAMNAWSNNTSITYFRDINNLVTNTPLFDNCTALSGLLEFKTPTTNGVSYLVTNSNVDIVSYPNVTSFYTQSFFENTTKKRDYYIPRCTALGTTSGDNSVFFGINSGSVIYVDPSLATNNGGNPDGDLQYAIGRGAMVKYVANFTVPNPVTTLSSGNIYNTAIQLNFTPPSSSNAIDFYRCYANGLFKNKIMASGDYITGLTASTSYALTIEAVDVYGNTSLISNTVSTSTNTTSYLAFRTIAAYHLSDGVDAKNGYNGTVGSSVTFSTGKNGNGANFIQNTNSKITIPYNSAFTFNNGTSDLPFSTSTWVKFTNTTNYFIFSKGASNRLYELTGGSSSLLFRLASNGNISNRIEVSTSFTPTVGVWYHIVSTYNGNKLNTGMNLYINGVLQSVTRSNFGTTYLGLSVASEPVYLGHFNPLTGYNLEGMMDECNWFNAELMATEVTNLYNSGTGLFYPF